MKRAVFLLILLAGLSCLVVAQSAKPPADEAALDDRVKELSQQLRCLVCQNETLADSQADLATDLKRQIREQMKAGKSNKEVLAFLTERYGDFVLYRPPVKGTTYLLWFGPFILLGGGLFALFRYIKQRGAQIREEPLSADEHKRALKLLQEESGKEPA